MPDDRNMRERIARRLFAMEIGVREAWDEYHSVIQTKFLAQADAILDELRNPTEAMVEEGEYNPNCIRQGARGPEPDLLKQWQAMIDTAKQGRG